MSASALVALLCVASAGPLAPFATATAAAPAKKGGTWVAFVQAKDVPANWKDALTAAAEESKDRTWVAPPAVSLDELQLALGCTGWNDACAGQIASMTGATMALVVEATGKDAGAVIMVQLVKAGGGATGPADKLELAGRTPQDLKLAEELVRGVVKGTKPAFLFVDTDTPKVDVFVDGERVGETPWRGKVTPGEHTLMLRQEGRAPLSKPFTVKPGATHTEVLSLGAAGPAVTIQPQVGAPTHEVVTPAAEAPTPGGSAQDTVVGWSLAGIGGASALIGAVVLTTTLVDLNRTVPCGIDGKTDCHPRELMFGLYQGKSRPDFLFVHGSAWIGGSIAAIAVGSLLVGTGVVLATAEEPPPAPATVAPPVAATP